MSHVENGNSGVSSGWSALPTDIVESISKKLVVYPDYARFRSVCASWRSSIPKIPTHIPTQLLWLMLPQSRFHSDGRSFFSLEEQRRYNLNLPAACFPRRICGSSCGWLAVVEESPRIFLINPLTRAVINLPPLSKFPNVLSFDSSNIGREYVIRSAENDHEDYTASLGEMRDNFIKKIVLSDSPSSSVGSYFVAVSIIRRERKLQVAYCKSDQNSWNLIEETLEYADDVTFFNGLIYSVHEEGVIAVSDVSGKFPRVAIIGSPYLNLSSAGNRIYLVNAMGKLLLVARFIGFEVVAGEAQWRGRTNDFAVFTYNFEAIDEPYWELLTDLGDNMLFLGENSSLAFSLSHLPGFRGNRIYFTNDFSEKGVSIFYEDDDDDEGIFNLENFRGDHDVGIFNLAVGTVETLTCSPQDLHVPLPSWSPPVWVAPNPFS